MSNLIEQGCVILTGVRLSYPHIATAQVSNYKKANGEDKPPGFGAVLLMPPEHPGFAEFMRSVNTLALAKWGDKASGVLGMIWQDPKKRCMGYGQEKIDTKTFKPRLGYEGMMFISTARPNMPQIIDGQGKGVDPANTGACQALARKMYAGCYVNVVVKPWMQDNAFGHGVRCELISIQFGKDGTPFGNEVTDASSLFQPTEAATAAPGAGGVPPWMPQTVPAAPVAPQWGAPQVPGMPAPPYAQQAVVPPFAQQAAPQPPWMPR